MSDSFEAHLLDLKHKSNTSSEEEGSSTGEDERTSDELDLHSEVIKLTDELSAARKKISKLELDINTSNSKLMYSTEKTATIDLLLDEKKDLEDCFHGMQQNIHKDGFQFDGPQPWDAHQIVWSMDTCRKRQK